MAFPLIADRLPEQEMLTMKTAQHDQASWFRPRKVHRASVLRRRGFRPRLEGLEDRTVPSTLTVTNNLDSGSGSLRAEIGHAKDGDTIAFDPALNGQTITLTSDELAIKNSVDIEGPGASLLAISGSNAVRVFDINEGLTVTIAGLTITHGRTLSGQGGGGILNMGSNLTLADDDLSDNEVDNAVAQGGGVANHNDGSLTAINTTFLGNQAVACKTGGIAFGGAILSGSFDGLTRATASISGCVFIDNSAIGADGGVVSGFFNVGSANGGAVTNETGGYLTVADSTFTGNRAIAGNGGSGGKFAGVCVVDNALGGGVFCADGAAMTVSGSAFSNNLAMGGSNASGSTGGQGRVSAGAGGGLDSLGAATITDSIFDHNQAIGGSGSSGGSGFTVVGRGSGGAISSSHFDDSPTTLNLDNCTFTDNQAVGGAATTSGTVAGDGIGGGLANFFGSTATVSGCVFAGNQAIGGAGNADVSSGNGFGGGAYNGAQSFLTMTTTTVTGNTATGGSAGIAGIGEGGGLCLANGGVACLDTFTQGHTKNNHASTDHDDIFGSFTTS
jgi:hypothetical protein